MKKQKLKRKEEVKLTDKELIKFMYILGVKEVKYLFIYNKIKLSSKQLDYVLSYED